MLLTLSSAFSFQFDVWIMMGLIGFCIGLIGFVLHQLIEKIADIKWEITQKYIEVTLLVGVSVAEGLV